MAKKLKITLIACLTVCLAAFVAIFAACDNNNDDSAGDTPSDGTVTYSITVEYEDGTIPSTDLRIAVQLCAVRDDGTQGLCLTPVMIDENGVAEFVIDVASLSEINDEISADTVYHIQINRVPETHTYDEELYTTVGQSSYTVVLTEVK